MTSSSQPTNEYGLTFAQTIAKCVRAPSPFLYREKMFSYKTCIVMFSILMMVFVGLAESKREEFTNQWAVEVQGGTEAANQIAEEHGFVNVGRVFKDKNIFEFVHHSIRKRSLTASTEHHEKLIKHEKVLWAEQQRIKRRVKRDLWFEDRPNEDLGDPLWKKTWYLQPNIQPSMRVMEAWKEGITGKGVVVTILDDGIEYSHPDLAANYDKLASYDINSRDSDPKPRPTFNNENRHGTRCAGEVAAVAGNSYCSAGIAFNASIGGIRMLDGKVTDLVESQSLEHAKEHVDIYSASWGPDDDGQTVDGPARLAKHSFRDGVKVGRGGKGSIFVWASGNGGKRDDNCNCDGYTNSIYTLSISSTTQNTNKPWYSESCSSTLAATYSSGTVGEKQIVTTDLDGKCTETHTGTSASAPLAAGICALALEANPDLTWRDMQHLVVRTANPSGLNAPDWKTNAVGRKVSHAYGYGLMDAAAMVKQAKKWVHVPEQKVCYIEVIQPPSRRDFQDRVTVVTKVSQCRGGAVMPDRLEHVQARLSVSAMRRGDLEIYLTSARGTVSSLLDRRRLDSSSKGFNDWPFMSTHMWDEDPRGNWTLEILKSGSTSNWAHLTNYTLVLYGTLDSDWPREEQATASEVTEAESTERATEKNVIMENIKEGDKTPVTVSSVKTTPQNCVLTTESGTGCMVCEDGYIKSPDKLYCLKQCPPGYFASSEDNKPPRTSDTWQSSGSKICVSCGAGPYCITCDRPGPQNCIKCMDNFEVIDGQCEVVTTTMNTASEQSKKIYILTILVCVLSIILFVFLFIFMHYCRNNCRCISSKPLYEYVPNEIDDADSRRLSNGSLKNSRYIKAPTVTYTNGNAKNNRSHLRGMEKSLINSSDDDGRN